MRIGIGTSIVGQQVAGGGVQYLDEVGGTPTAAYSVDKVVSTYTDAVVEVRRTVSAVTVEADVAFDGNTITLDSAVTITSGSSSATTLGEFVAASGYTDVDSLGSAQDAFVTTWYDQAGSNDATQTTAADQPKIVSAGALVTENGKVALDFDGTNHYLSCSNYLTTNPISLFVVTKQGSPTATNNGIFNANSAQPFAGTNGIRLDNFQGNARFGVNGSFITSSNDITAVQMRSAFANSNSWDLFIDSQAEATASGVTPDFTGVTDVNIGRMYDSLEMLGSIQEIIVYNSDKSALRTAIEDNINGRFSIYP